MARFELVSGKMRKQPNYSAAQTKQNEPFSAPNSLNSVLDILTTPGGLLGYGAKQLGVPQAIKSALGSIVPSEPEDYSKESWSDYLLRNIAKTPALAYELGASGLGLGNIAELAGRKLGAPESVREVQRRLLPSTAQAQSQIEELLPGYLTKHGPTDRPIETAITEAPFLIGAGLTGGLGGLGLAAAKSLGSIAGGELGRTVGGSLGKMLGDEEIGQLLGGIAGGVAGAKGAGKLARRISPEDLYSEKVFNKEKNQAMLAKKEALKPLEKIKQENASFKTKINDLEALQKQQYDLAQKFEKGYEGNPSNIMKTVKEAGQDISKGLIGKDKQIVTGLVKDLNTLITKGDTLSLADAKRAQKNLNGIRYDRNVSPNVKRTISPIIDSFNEFIEQTGPAQHTAAWKQAEAATREVKRLKQGSKEFVSQQNRSLQEAKPQVKADIAIQDAKLKELGTNGKEYLRKKGIDPANFVSRINNYAAIHGLFDIMRGRTLKGIGTLTAGKIGQGISKNRAINDYVFKNHPEIYNEGRQILKDLRKGNEFAVARRVNDWGKKIEKKAEQSGFKISNFEVVSGGLKKQR